MGIRLGDKDEDKYSVGIGTSDNENALEFIDRVCAALNVTRDVIHCYSSIPEFTKNRNEYEIEFSQIFQIPEQNIHVKKTYPSQRHKKNHHTIKIFNSVASKLFDELDRNLVLILLKSPAKVKYHFLRGIIDSDGRVRKSGSVEIEMSIKNLHKLKIIQEVLSS